MDISNIVMCLLETRRRKRTESRWVKTQVDLCCPSRYMLMIQYANDMLMICYATLSTLIHALYSPLRPFSQPRPTIFLMLLLFYMSIDDYCPIDFFLANLDKCLFMFH